MTITPIGIGTWAIGGGDWVCGWGPQTDAESLAAIRRSLDLGINWIDTAGVYGLGHSETVVARALRDMAHGERPYVFTTCSLVWDDLGNVAHSLEPRSIRREAEASLRRLAIGCIDLYQLGWPAWPQSPPGHNPGSLERAWEMMAALQCEGKARFIGVSNCNQEQLERLVRIAPVTSLQTPYSLLQRESEDSILPFCDANHIGVIAYSPMQSGLLAGRMTRDRVDSLPHNDWRRQSPYFHDPMLTHALELVDQLRAVGARHGRTPGEIAIAWTLHNPAVTAASVGVRHARQMDELIGAASLRLTAHDIDRLEHPPS